MRRDSRRKSLLGKTPAPLKSSGAPDERRQRFAAQPGLSIEIGHPGADSKDWPAIGKLETTPRRFLPRFQVPVASVSIAKTVAIVESAEVREDVTGVLESRDELDDAAMTDCECDGLNAVADAL